MSYIRRVCIILDIFQRKEHFIVNDHVFTETEEVSLEIDIYFPQKLVFTLQMTSVQCRAWQHYI